MATLYTNSDSFPPVKHDTLLTLYSLWNTCCNIDERTFCTVKANGVVIMAGLMEAIAKGEYGDKEIYTFNIECIAPDSHIVTMIVDIMV